MHTVSFFNRKGGTGKSSLSFLTARYLAAAGRKTLVVDLDPQKTLTDHFLRLERNAVRPAGDAFGLLLEKNTLKECLIDLDEHLFLVPGSFDLSEIQSNVPIYAVGDALKNANAEFEFCLVDNAPNWSALIQSALHASRLIVIPALPAIEDVEQAHWSLQRAARVSGGSRRIVLNQHGAKPGRQVREILEHYRPAFNGHILESSIPQSGLVRRYTGTGERISQSRSKAPFLNSFARFMKESFEIEKIPEVF